MFRSLFLLLLLCWGCSFKAFAQKKNASFEYHIHRANAPLAIDGSGDDAAWQSAEVVSDFYMVLPMDTSKAQVRTEVRMLYDDKQMYLLAVCYEKVAGPYMVESLRRDFSFGKNDNFLVFLDPFDDQTNGFTFGSNAEGAQWDGLLFDGGAANLGWDNKWTSAVATEEDKWTFEMAVPFKTLRYKAGITRWGVNFSRLDMKTTEKSAWTPVPRQFPTASLAYTGVLVWDEPPPPAGLNASLIPYALASTSKNQEQHSDGNTSGQVGLDAKMALTSALNLDLTLNPDFSQVEVDRQQTNLDRFELFFPERRQFFLENGDLMTNFGYSSIRPFFSRRIGLNSSIQYGARLSGKLDKNWRVNLMDMKTNADESGTPDQNFAVVALQRQLFARSNITMLAINKQTLDYDQVTNTDAVRRYNRNLGFEYNLLSANNVWRGKVLYLKSFSPGIQSKDQVFAANLGYNDRKWELNAQYESVGKDYRAEVGYVPRTGYQNMSLQGGRWFFVKSGSLINHGPSIMSTSYLSPSGQLTEFTHALIYRFNFKDRSYLGFWTARDHVKLLQPFDPTNFTGIPLQAGTQHNWGSFGGEYISKPQQLLTYSMSWRYGGYYANGKRLRLVGELGYRMQPYAAITMNASFNHLAFGDSEVLPLAMQHTQYDFWLIGPRIDLTLTNKLFFTNFIQYNNQTENINLNLRFQWRYSPASDFFIVYTDNYFSDSLRVRNRALVAKFTFWWNY